MSCQRCASKRIMCVGAKSSDLHNWRIGEVEGEGYLPNDIGIGGGDYIDLDYCLDCGQIQGAFPLPITETEKGEEE